MILYNNLQFKSFYYFGFSSISKDIFYVVRVFGVIHNNVPPGLDESGYLDGKKYIREMGFLKYMNFSQRRVI
jgi:hypothetical protein